MGVEQRQPGAPSIVLHPANNPPVFPATCSVEFEFILQQMTEEAHKSVQGH